MSFTPASLPSVMAFIAIVAAVLALFFIGVAHAYRAEPMRRTRIVMRTAVIVALWLGLLAALVGSGQLERLPLKGLPVFFAGVFVIVIVAGVSSFGGRLAAGLPLAGLVGFQAFRLPLELVLHAWAEQGTIPPAMTWTGHNWDIISGGIALLAAPLANRHRGAAWAANVIGAVLLLNVIRVVILTAPLPFGWNVTPPLLLAFHLPYALIAPVCVGGAILGHIVLTRALLRPRAPLIAHVPAIPTR
jgi:hypothetical protein